MWIHSALVLVAAAMGIAGCASITPAAPPVQSTTSSASSAVSRANVTHEYSPSEPPHQQATVWGTDPTTIIHAFATAYINWNAGNVSGRLRALAAASIGQARSAMQTAAGNASRDYELHRGGIANSGSVEAIAPLQGGRDQYVVVTREQTTAANSNAYQGLQPAWHVTIATVQQLRPDAWVISGWQPET